MIFMVVAVNLVPQSPIYALPLRAPYLDQAEAKRRDRNFIVSRSTQGRRLLISMPITRWAVFGGQGNFPNPSFGRTNCPT